MATVTYYAGTFDTSSTEVGNLKYWLGQTISVGDQEANVTISEILEFVESANQEIDGVLGQVYIVPLIQITRNSITDYPAPIPLLAKQLSAAFAIIARTKDITQAATAVKYQQEVILKLTKMVNGIGAGTIRLPGQTLKAKNRFVRPTTAPVPLDTEIRSTPGGAVG